MGRPRAGVEDHDDESKEVVLLPVGTPLVRWCATCEAVRGDTEWTCPGCGQRTTWKPKVLLDG